MAIALLGLLTMSLSPGCGGILPSQTHQSERFSLASLKGNYTYNLGGIIFNLSPGFNIYDEVGAFVADGNGGLTGVDDFSAGGKESNNPFNGSYTVNGDGTGTMIFNLPGRTIQLATTMRSDGEVYLLEYDSFATGTGGALTQASSAISGTLSGAYVFRTYSHAAGAATTGGVGSSATAGQMIVSATSITGNEDFTQIGTTSSHAITGSLSQPDNNGRGTLSLTETDTGNTSNYVYYAIDSNTLNLIRTDMNVVGEGRSIAQTDTSFTAASLTSGFIFHLGGDTGANVGGIAGVGVFTADGNGNITSGSLDSAVDGSATNESVTGTYSVNSSGRVTITLTPSGGSPISQVAWMANSTQGFFIQQDQNSVASGGLAAQQGGPFSAASAKGEYVFRMVGYDGSASPSVGRIGVVTFDGNSTITFSDMLVNRGGVKSQFSAVSGSYTASANGRIVTGTISGVTDSMVFYLTSDMSGYFLLADNGAEIGGQYGIQSPQ